MYTYNMEVYIQPEGPFRMSNKAPDIVKQINQPLKGTGRTVTGDNWFTDLALGDEFEKQKLTYVGTVRKNKKQLSSTFVNMKGRVFLGSRMGKFLSLTLQKTFRILSSCQPFMKMPLTFHLVMKRSLRS